VRQVFSLCCLKKAYTVFDSHFIPSYKSYIKVDLPDPFSPAKKVTLGCNSISFSFTMAGIEKRYSLNDATLSLFKATSNIY
jgi:hypothetical protein